MQLPSALLAIAMLSYSASALAPHQFERRAYPEQGKYWNATFFLNPPCQPGPQNRGFSDAKSPPFNVDCKKWDFSDSPEYSSAIVQASSSCKVTLYSDTECNNEIAGPFTNNAGSQQCRSAPSGQKFMGYKVECQPSSNSTLASNATMTSPSASIAPTLPVD